MQTLFCCDAGDTPGRLPCCCRGPKLGVVEDMLPAAAMLGGLQSTLYRRTTCDCGKFPLCQHGAVLSAAGLQNSLPGATPVNKDISTTECTRPGSAGDDAGDPTCPRALALPASWLAPLQLTSCSWMIGGVTSATGCCIWHAH